MNSTPTPQPAPGAPETSPSPRRSKPTHWSWNALSLGSLVAIACMGYFVYQIRETLLVLVGSIFMAYVLQPPVDRLARLPLPRARTLGRKRAAGIVVLLAVIVLGFALYWFVPILWIELQRLGRELPNYYRTIEEWLARMEARRGMGLPPEVWAALQSEWHGLIERSATGVGQAAVRVAGTLGNLLGLLVVPIGAFYILADGGTLTRNFVEGLPASWRPMAGLLLTEADRSLATYVRGQTLVVMVCAVIASLIFTGIGVRYSLALGVVAGIAEAVPFLGSVAVVGALAIVTSSQGLTQMLIVLGAYIALNQVNNYVINPRLMSTRLELHPFIIILAVLAGSALGGFLGAVLALPVAALVVALGGALWGAGRPETRAK
jgi:predicted PurR-regulated permease PerM